MKQLIALDPDALDATAARLERVEELLAAIYQRIGCEWMPARDYMAAKKISDDTLRRWIARGTVRARGTGHHREIYVGAA